MKKYMVTLGFSLILVVVGVALTISEIIEFDIVDDFDTNSLSEKTITYNYKTADVINEIDSSFTKRPIIIYDDIISKGNIKITVTYYDEIMEIENQAISNNDSNYIKISADGADDFRSVKSIFNLTIDGLKNKEIYNYPEALKPTVKVYINKDDKDIVKIRK